MRYCAQPGIGRMAPDCDGPCAPAWQLPCQLCGFMRSRLSGLSTTVRGSCRLSDLARSAAGISVCVGDLLLDLVPVLRAFLQFVGPIRDALNGMHAHGRSCRIRNAAADDMLGRILDIDRSDGIVACEVQRPF